MNQIPRYLGICQISEGSEPLSVSTSHVKERVTPRYQADTDRPDTHQDTPTLRQRHGGQRPRHTAGAAGREGRRVEARSRAASHPRCRSSRAPVDSLLGVELREESECSSVVSLADGFWRSPCILPAAENRRARRPRRRPVRRSTA